MTETYLQGWFPRGRRREPANSWLSRKKPLDSSRQAPRTPSSSPEGQDKQNHPGRAMQHSQSKGQTTLSLQLTAGTDGRNPTLPLKPRSPTTQNSEVPLCVPNMATVSETIPAKPVAIIWGCFALVLGYFEGLVALSFYVASWPPGLQLNSYIFATTLTNHNPSFPRFLV